ncbi:hypothetical protein RBH48_20255 [Escherichia coli]
MQNDQTDKKELEYCVGKVVFFYCCHSAGSRVWKPGFVNGDIRRRKRLFCCRNRIRNDAPFYGAVLSNWCRRKPFLWKGPDNTHHHVYGSSGGADFGRAGSR